MNETKNFLVLCDLTTNEEIEQMLENGYDLVIVSSPSEYYDGAASKTAIRFMEKYPERKIFVTERALSPILERVSAKAESGADLMTTYLYAENLAKALSA